ncbi:Uncharacterized protein FWK35_00034362 [Aphis craccivora]|uniref:Uncharacterized protein n=1 Tax=Aphis craccivora TaxID=307492 RepID=A0A6G0VXR1_APHCR|nr:Uncharacterized protein FWK35_00034362 [Aphis craccivora]
MWIRRVEPLTSVKANINPSNQTIKAIEEVLKKYGNPKNPSEHKWPYFEPNYSGYPIRNTLNCITNIEAPVVEPAKDTDSELRSTDIEYCDKPVVEPTKGPALKLRSTVEYCDVTQITENMDPRSVRFGVTDALSAQVPEIVQRMPRTAVMRSNPRRI